MSRKHEGTEAQESFKFEGISVDFNEFKRVEFHEGIPDILDDIFEYLICFGFKKKRVSALKSMLGIIIIRVWCGIREHKKEIFNECIQITCCESREQLSKYVSDKRVYEKELCNYSN